MMQKLTALILSAAIVPALALSTAAFAVERDDEKVMEEQAGDQASGAGEPASGTQGAAGQRAGEQASGEQYLSGKPAGAFYADDVIGQTVIHRGTDEDVGEIQDLVIGEDGRIIGVVVTTSGFLGLGGQEVGLGWDHIERTMEEDESVFYTEMDEKSLQNAPEYERE